MLALPSTVAAPAVFLFLGSLGFVLFVVAGYPLLLELAVRLRPRAVATDPDAPLPTVSVILPVRNGQQHLGAKLESLLAMDYPPALLEVLVVSDGSTDGTVEIARGYAASPVRVKLLEIPPSGKWAALNRGIAAASGEVLFFTDVRQRMNSDCLRQLVASLSDPAVGAVSGELMIAPAGGGEGSSIGLYWRYEKWIRRRQSRLHSAPGATGCVYAMRRALARPLPPHTLLDDVHLPLGAFFAGYRIVFNERARVHDYPSTLSTEFRRKVRTLAGVYQTTAAFPKLLIPVHALWVHWLAHKLGRLLLPYALVVMLAASFALPAPWSAVALLAQGAGYGLAAADAWVPVGWPLKRLTGAARTVTVLLLAAVCAASILFRPARSFWTPTRIGQETAA